LRRARTVSGKEGSHQSLLSTALKNLLAMVCCVDGGWDGPILHPYHVIVRQEEVCPTTVMNSCRTRFGEDSGFFKHGCFLVIFQHGSLNRLCFPKRVACARSEFLFAFPNQSFLDGGRFNRLRRSTSDEPDSHAYSKRKDGADHINQDRFRKCTVAQTRVYFLLSIFKHLAQLLDLEQCRNLMCSPGRECFNLRRVLSPLPPRTHFVASNMTLLSTETAMLKYRSGDGVLPDHHHVL
jgi:hypothetical protein